MPVPYPPRPETKELFSSHIPALQVLIAMGYHYLASKRGAQKTWRQQP